MDTGRIALFALRFLLFVPAIILHEVAHGYVAYRLGDPTAHDAGRLTLNPIAHVDLVGTIIVPGVLLIMSFVSGGSFVFGWAKPVPVNPYLMRKTTVQNGMLLTGLAGPVTNIGLGVISGLTTRALVPILGSDSVVVAIFGYFAFVNLLLAFFNLLPIPPMDGSRVVQRFLSGGALSFYESLERFGFVIIFGILFLAPGALYAYLDVTVFPILSLLTGQ